MKSGVSVIELLVACAVLALVVLGGSYSLKPVSEANKKFRLTNKAHRLEDEIRRGIYYQSNYTHPAGFTIDVNGVVLAREGETRYVSEDLTASKTVVTESEKKSAFPFATKIALVPNASMPTGWGLVYQVNAADDSVGMAKLGTTAWPTNIDEYITEHHTTDHTIISVPEELATSVAKNCTSGVMKGIRRNSSGAYEAVCWEYEALSSPPDWAIPTSFTLTEATNKIKLEYSPLNRPKCPDMSITNFTGKTWNIPNFYAFKSIDMRDLFPAKTAGSVLSSECEKVIDFYKSDPTGLLPVEVVQDATINKKPGVCPDKNLYVLNPDGSCKVNFDPAAIPERAPARSAP